MIAVRYHLRTGVIHVRRLHAALTLTEAQRILDTAIDAGTAAQFWGADDQPVTFDPRECNDVQVLDLHRG